jgi:hypothetical protein
MLACCELLERRCFTKPNPYGQSHISRGSLVYRLFLRWSERLRTPTSRSGGDMFADGKYLLLSWSRAATILFMMVFR